MKIKVIVTIMLAVGWLLVGCGQGTNQGTPSTVQASSPTPSSISMNCSSGTEGQIDDGSGVLQVNWGPCLINATGNQPVGLSNQSVSYVTKYPIKGLELEGWVGTLAGSKIEVGEFLMVQTPDGRKAFFSNQYDKHQDIVGSQTFHWQVPLVLPAGTTLTLGMAAGVTNPETDCPCGVQVTWTVNQGIN